MLTDYFKELGKVQQQIASSTIKLDYDIVEGAIKQLKNEMQEAQATAEARQKKAVKEERQIETAMLEGTIQAYKEVVASLRKLQADIHFKQLTKNVKR